MPQTNADAEGASKDIINAPSHYTMAEIEPIDFIEAHRLNFNRGNVIKYVTRAPWKGSELADLKKARFYLDREIAKLEDAAFDDVSNEQREFCERHDEAYARVDEAMKPLATATTWTEAWAGEKP